MLTNLTTTNITHLPDGTEQISVTTIRRDNGVWSLSDYVWLTVIVAFWIYVFYPLLKWLYRKARSIRTAKVIDT